MSFLVEALSFSLAERPRTELRVRVMSLTFHKFISRASLSLLWIVSGRLSYLYLLVDVVRELVSLGQ